MNGKIIIAIDAMGGENAPYKNIEGVSLFLKINNKKKDLVQGRLGTCNNIALNQQPKIADFYCGII